MTIQSASIEIEQLIDDHSVYAAECLIYDIAYAGRNNPYINCAVLHGLVEAAYDRMSKEIEEGDNKYDRN